MILDKQILDFKTVLREPFTGTFTDLHALVVFASFQITPGVKVTPGVKESYPPMVKSIQAEGSRAQIEKLPQLCFTKPSRNLHGIGVTFLGFDWRGNSPQLPLHHKTSHFASRASSRWLHGPSRMWGFQLLRYPFTDTFTGASRTFTDTCFLKRPG